LKTPIVAFHDYDLDRVIHDKAAVERVNPHRFELSLLDGILFEDWTGFRAVGFHDVPLDAFWARGHFPGKPMMPGVLICEVAAQLCAWFANHSGLLGNSIIGLGALDKVRFRLPVQPGDKLVVQLKREKYRQNVLINGLFEGYVGTNLAVEGIIKGVAIR
jgi:3-hydroxyacyl-[acyl-carrier-protein] dehydratase